MSLIKITPADREFSLCVRERAGWTCERCSAPHPPPTQALHCAHWHSRANWSVRFDPYNACAMCMGCHLLTSARRDEEHRPLMLKLIGDLQMDRLWSDKCRLDLGRRARKSVKQIASHYRAEHKRMQDLRADGVIGRLDFADWLESAESPEQSRRIQTMMSSSSRDGPSPRNQAEREDGLV